jgi:hypothetical protein
MKLPNKTTTKIGVILKEVSNSYDIFYDRIRQRCPFNTGDCLIEV